MTNGFQRSTLMIACCILAFTLIASAETPDARRGNAREITALFFDAALKGKFKEAAALGEPGRAYSQETKIREIAELKLASLQVAAVIADDDNAIATTNSIKGDHNREGPLVITLVRKDELWWVRDIDLDSAASAKAKIEQFQKARPKAKPVPEAGKH